MNVSVLKEKKLVFYIIYAFWMRKTFNFFFFFFWSLFLSLCVPLECGDLESVKFCNNIKRRYGRVNNDLFPVFFFRHSSTCVA